MPCPFDKYLSAFCPWYRRHPRVSVIRMTGVIGRVGPMRGGMTLAGYAAVLERAFAPKRLAAVALAINSPGGSPAQSSLLLGRIRALAEEKKVPVLAFIEDVGASGGYWLACAGDEIYANENSIIGSIGVVSAGFGFQETIRRLGIERRLHTAGAQKAILDPFLEEQPAHVKRLTAIQKDMHETFKALVRARRGDRLVGPEKEVFSGAFWVAGQARALGLIDGIGELRSVLRERFGDKTRFRVFEPRRPLLRRRLGLVGSGAGAGDWITDAIAAVEERGLWARFGL